VNSVGVVIVDVFAEESSKVVLVQDDHVIEQLSASCPSSLIHIHPRRPYGVRVYVDGANRKKKAHFRYRR